MMHAVRVATGSLGIALLTVTALAQQTADRPTFRSGVNLVDVAVVVRDRDGNIARDLTATDFTVSEKGIPQTFEIVGSAR